MDDRQAGSGGGEGPVDFRSEIEIGRVLRLRVQQRPKARVDIFLQATERQVVRTVAEWLLHLRSNVIHAPKHENHKKTHQHRQHRAWQQDAADHRRCQTIQHQYSRHELHPRKWERDVCHVPSLRNAHGAAGQLLEAPRQNRRSYVHHSGPVALHHQLLYPLDQDFHALVGVPLPNQEAHLLKLHALPVQRRVRVRSALGHRLERHLAQDTHQPGQSVLEYFDIILLARVVRTKCQQTAERVEPLSAR
mmetsp:Transcript_27999/g.84426  ORF Transcript_27999/g.84426 Transcript_27999/m.84426 type:complete len:248 (+) Transcript_27999:529-1272(+)